MLYFLVAFLFSEYSTSIMDIYDYIFIPMSFLCFLYLFTKVRIETTIKWSVRLGTLNAVVSIYEFLTNKLLLNIGGENYVLVLGNSQIRSNGLLGSPLTNGMILTIVALMVLYCYHESGRKRYLFFLGINAVALLMTLSRGPIVAFVVAVVFLYFNLKHKNSLKKVLKYIGILLVVIIGINILLHFSSNIKSVFLLRILAIFDWSGEGGNISRIDTWQYYLSIIKDNLLFGMGISSIKNSYLTVPESGMVYILYEVGIIGFCMYYVFYVVELVRSLSMINVIDQINRGKLVLGCSIAFAILIENCVLQIITSLVIQLLFGMSIAIIIFSSTKLSKNKITSKFKFLISEETL